MKCDPHSSHYPTYKKRWFKSTGAAQILLYSFTAFLSSYNLSFQKDIFFYKYGSLILLVCPFLGWLADVRYGRYKFISHSLRLLWVVLTVQTLVLVVAELLGDFPGYRLLRTILAVAEVLPMAGIFSSTLQLGIDQLPHAASTQDLISYITWYSWTMFLAGGVYAFAQRCVCKGGIYSTSLSYLLLPLICTLSVLLDVTMNHRLVKEPVTRNPLRLVYQVVRYAAKHRHPRLRSAFTYWDDKPYSRIDLGKAKYGGPFTTEQVEDVKTFFKVLAVIASLLPLCFLVANTFIVISKNLMFHYRDKGFIRYCPNAASSSLPPPSHSSVSDFFASCFKRTSLQFMNLTAMVFLIPLVEFVLYPLCGKWRCFAQAGLLHWLCAGASLLVVSSTSFLSIELLGHQCSSEGNVTCLFSVSEDTVLRGLTLNIDISILALPQIFFGVSTYLLFTNVATFIMAQAPYAMRGMLFGICYFFLGVCIGISEIILKFTTIYVNKYWPASRSGHAYCGVWYHGLMVLLTVGALCGMGAVKKCYKPRRRDEDVHNQQIFAVEYYEKYLPRNDTSDSGQDEPLVAN